MYRTRYNGKDLTRRYVVMFYQPIECDHTVKNPLICDDSNYNDFGFEEKDFIAGIIISNWPEGILYLPIKV